MPRVDTEGILQGPSTQAHTTTNIVKQKWFGVALLAVCLTSHTMVMGFAVKTSYIKSTSVVAQEFAKLVLSIFMLARENNNDWRRTWVALQGLSKKKRTLWKMAVPAVLYAIGNILTLYIVFLLSPAAYQVLAQLKIVTGAFFCRIILQKVISSNKVAAIGVLMVGVITVQLSQAKNHVPRPGADIGGARDTEASTVTVGVMLAVIQAIISGFCGAYLEKQFRGSDSHEESMWIKNVQLAGLSIVFGFLLIVANGDARAVWEGGFFQGYDGTVLASIILAAFGGIINGMVMKNSGNIVKGFVVGISMLMTVFLSALLLDFKIYTSTIFGALLVILATLQYSDVVVFVKTGIPFRSTVTLLTGCIFGPAGFATYLLYR